MVEFPLPTDAKSGIRVGRVMVFGSVNAGKTELMARLAVQMVRSVDQIYVVSTVAKLAKLINSMSPDPNVKCHYFDTPPLNTDIKESLFSSFKGRRILVVSDEFDSYSKGSRSVGSPALYEINMSGRNFGTSLLLGAHGTSEVAKSLIAQSQVVLFSRTTEPNLLDYARKYMKAEIPDIEMRLRKLPNHVFLVWCPPSTPKFQGYLWVNLQTNEIETASADLTSTPDPSETSDAATAPTTPDGTADTPSAASPSTTDADPASAPTTSG